MPTGYTADVADGKTTEFRDFALLCARAFGATVMQRDDPLSERPKHREMPDFYAEWLARAKAEEARFAAMTPAEAEVEMVAERDAAIAYRDDYLSEKAAKRARYEAMLAEAEAWVPPTADHAELREFMAKQLRESIDFDCGGSYVPAVPEPRPAEAWLADKRTHAAGEVARNLKSIAEEQARCDTANAWIDALYASLPAAAPAERGQ